MRVATAISSTIHAGLLTWGLFFVESPKAFIVDQVEAVPVDLVTISEFSQSVKGEEKAVLRQKPTTRTLVKKEPEPEAEHVGKTEIDRPNSKTAELKPEPVEASQTEPSQIKATDTQKQDAKEQPSQKDQDTPVPTTEIARLNEQAKPVAEPEPETVTEQPVQAQKEAEFQLANLPKTLPQPIERPDREKAQSAQTTAREIVKEQTKKKQEAKKAEPQLEDKIAALINKEKPTQSGKKPNQKQASLGGKKTNAAKLSRSEIDGLRSAIEKCWNPPAGIAGIETMKAKVTMDLAKDGSIEGRPKVSASGGSGRGLRTFSESVRRAVLRCAPYDLPKAKHDTWSQMVVNFDTSGMF